MLARCWAPTLTALTYFRRWTNLKKCIYKAYKYTAQEKNKQIVNL